MANFCIGGVIITPSGAVDSPGGITPTTISDCSASCGTSGQILSSTGSGVFWVSPSYLSCSILTDKGSLISASGANTPVALPVGTDGQVLVACSACTTGLAWQTIPAATPSSLGTVFGLTQSSGSCTVALGSSALLALTSGVRNTAVGTTALTGVTTGGSNTALGFGAGSSLTTGSSNTLIGCGSGCRVTTPTLNVAVGHQSMAAITSGDGNVAVGANAMNASLLGCCAAACTIAVGFCAGNRGGNLNIFVGRQSGYCLPETTAGTTIIGPYSGLATENLQCNIILATPAASGDGNKRLQINECGAFSVSGTDYGTAGQILTSCGSTAPWAWTSPSWIPCSTIVAKGDIVVGTAASTPGALTVGTNGQFLAACSACATGLTWVPGVNAATPLVAGVVFGCTPSTLCNTVIGLNAFLCNTTGFNNVAIGTSSLAANTAGSYNTHVGAFAGFCTTTGGANTAVGFNALRETTTASNLVAMGSSALRCNTTGTSNVGIGNSALRFGTTANANTAVGFLAGCRITTGFNNIFLGGTSGHGITTGSNNIAIGSNTLTNASGDVTATGNVAVGTTALTRIGAGAENSAFGLGAGGNLTGGSYNTVIGNRSFNTGTSAATGGCNTTLGARALTCVCGAPSLNVAVGYNAGNGLQFSGSQNVLIGSNVQVPSSAGSCQLVIGFSPTSNWLTGCSDLSIQPGGGIRDNTGSLGSAGTVLTSTATGIAWCPSGGGGGGGSPATPTVAGLVYGKENSSITLTSLGYGSGACSTGTGNTFVGTCVAPIATTGTNNTGLGAGTLVSMTTGSNNTALGYSLSYLTSGSNNTSVGLGALAKVTTGGCNTAVGYAAGSGSSGTGCGNTYIGYCVESGIGTGNPCFNVAIGHLVALPVTGGCCQLVIGFSSTENWLTGCSDKSIRPGAGIRDNNGCLGTSGQVLTTTGTGIAWCPASAAPATPQSEGVVFACTPNCDQSAFGWNALKCITVGDYNTAIGTYSLFGMTSGCHNTMIGDAAGWQSVESVANIAIGSLANVFAKGCYNIGIGNNVGNTGSCAGEACNVYIGHNIQNGPITPTAPRIGNVIIGSTAGFCLAGCQNTIVGNAAGISVNGTNNLVLGSNVTVPTGSCQMALGWDATNRWLTGCSDKSIRPGGGVRDNAGGLGTTGQVLTSTGTGIAWCTSSGSPAATPLALGTVYACTPTTGNTTLGYQTSANGFSTSIGNTLLGACQATVGTIVGAENTFVGFRVGNTPSNAAKSQNTYVGAWAGTNSGGCVSGNSALGYGALQTNNGCCNVGIGFLSMYSSGLPANSDNVAIGTCSLYSFGAVNGCTVQWGNIAIGFKTLLNLQYGENNIALGAEWTKNTTYIGLNGPALSNANNRIVMGNQCHTCAQVKIGWTIVSDIRDKAIDPAGVPYGLSFVEKINPIAFQFCDRETQEITDEKLRYGFSAQEIAALENGNDVIVSTDNPEKFQFTEAHLLPVLVNAIKELSAEVKQLRAELDELKS